MNTINAIIFITLSTLLGTFDKAEIPLDSIDSLIQKIGADDAILVYNSIQALKEYPLSEFSDAHRDALSSQLLEETPHLNKLVELCGFLLMKEELRAFAQNKNLPKRIKEKVNYALVRAGDEEKLQQMLRNLKKHTLTDDFSYNLVPMLAYTRQKEVFDYLLELIMKEGKSCNHPDADTPGKFSCAYPIIISIAPYISDFPAEVGEYGLETDNPDQMLADVRQWILSSKKSYQLDTEKY